MVNLGMNNKLRLVWIYLLVWLLYMFCEVMVFNGLLEAPFNLKSSVPLILHSVCKLCVFIFILKYIIPSQATLSLKGTLFRRTALILETIVVWNCLVHFLFLPRFFDSYVYFSGKQNFWFQVITYTVVISWAITYRFAQLFFTQQQQQQFNQQENDRLNDAIKQAELTSLKKQISPHFFYNTLNFFYAQSVQYSENLSRGIMLLSEIMRYAIKDDDEEGKVHLSKEVAQIQNYVELNQLRFDNRLCVQLNIKGNLEYRRIVPLILLTFVENAFKFGDLSNPDHPLLIEILVKENHLIFKTYNKKCSEAKKQSGGIGLSNTRRRLLLAYPNRHKLTTSDEGDFFSLTLHLVL
jgi:sensor histidine kinase YesM